MPGRDLRFSRSGHRLLALNGLGQKVTVDTSTGLTFRVTPSNGLYLPQHAFSPDLDQFSVFDHNGISAGSMETGVASRTIGPHQVIPECRGVQILADRYLQATKIRRVPGAAVETPVLTWDLQTGARIHGFPEVAHVDVTGRIRGVIADRVSEFRPDGSRAVRTGLLATLIPSPLSSSYPYPAVRWTDDGRYVYSDNRHLATTEFRVWDASTGELVATVDTLHESWDETSNPNNLGNPLYFDGGNAFNFPWLNVGPHLTDTADVLLYADGWGLNNQILDVVRIWRAPWDQPPSECPTDLYNSSHSGVRYTGMSHDGQVLVTNDNNDSPENVASTVLINLETGERMAEIATGIPHIPMVFEFSPGNDYLLATRQVWDWRKSERLWACSDPEHALGLHNLNYRGAALFSDDRHVVIAQDGQYQIWDWRDDHKRATLFLTPEPDGYVFFNHETGHWTGPALGRQYLQFAATGDDGESVWLTPFQYEERIGWENDETQAGLEFQID